MLVHKHKTTVAYRLLSSCGARWLALRQLAAALHQKQLPLQPLESLRLRLGRRRLRRLPAAGREAQGQGLDPVLEAL